MESPGIPHLDVALDFDKVTVDDENLRSVLNEVRPKWTGLPLDIKPVVGGNLNRNFRVQPSDGATAAVFLNVINPIASFMIQNHLKVRRILSKNAIGPELYATFQNGMCSQFLQGADLETSGQRHLLKEPDMMRKCAHELARFHSKSLYDQAREQDVEENLTLFKEDLFRQFWPSVAGNEKMPLELRSELPDAETIVKEFHAQIAMMQTIECETRLCHCDYNPANMMLGPDGTLTVVDFDGSMISYPALDIAYLFLFVFNNHFAPDDSLIATPDDYYSAWCRSYLTSRNQLDGAGDIPDQHVDKLVFQIKKAMLVIYLRLTCSSGILSFMGHAADSHQRRNFLKFSVNCWRAYQSAKDEVGAMSFPQ